MPRLNAKLLRNLNSMNLWTQRTISKSPLLMANWNRSIFGLLFIKTWAWAFLFLKFHLIVIGIYGTLKLNGDSTKLAVILIEWRNKCSSQLCFAFRSAPQWARQLKNLEVFLFNFSSTFLTLTRLFLCEILHDKMKPKWISINYGSSKL